MRTEIIALTNNASAPAPGGLDAAGFQSATYSPRARPMPASADSIVYKILAADTWRRAVAVGRYDGSPDDARDGFIHLSTAGQVAGTAARHFKGQAGLVLVGLDAAKMGSALRWEPSRGGDLFPHLYGPLDPAAVISVEEMTLGPDGVPMSTGESAS